MKIYYPQDSEGNTIGFKTHESCIFDATGEKLSSKLEKINSKINKSISAPDGLSYNDATLSLDKGASVVSSVNIGKVSDTVSFDENTNILSLKRGNETISFTEITVNGGTGVPVGPCTSISVTPGNGSITIKWTDPSDVIVGETTIVTWSGTKLLYKAGSYPENVNDGILVVDSKVRNQYSSTGYTINELTNGETYYFRLFPYSEGHNYNMDAENEISSTPVKPPIIYGFKIDAAESDPYESVSYISGCDNENFRPAHMDFTNNAFDYGDWEDAFFMPRPCMLKSDGTVAYYLNPNYYTKKEDGTASDITNTAFDGNAMMEWGRDGKKIWVKVVPVSATSKSASASVYIADEQVDSGYKAWSFINNQGNMVDHFYTPIYNGSYISNKMRSLSGQTCGVSQDAYTEIDYAKANNKTSNVLWYTEVLADRILINFLLILLGKSLDTQNTFGKGRSKSSGTINTGTMNNKGLFWGDNGGVNGVKVFGMENWWGNICRRTAGCIMDGYNQKIKLTYGTQDGSSASSYNTDGTGYISENTVSASGFISEMKFDATRAIMVPKTGSGSDSTYYADMMFTSSNPGPYYACFGGVWGVSAGCGAFSAHLHTAASGTNTDIGAALSCKPLS